MRAIRSFVPRRLSCALATVSSGRVRGRRNPRCHTARAYSCPGARTRPQEVNVEAAALWPTARAPVGVRDRQRMRVRRRPVRAGTHRRRAWPRARPRRRSGCRRGRRDPVRSAGGAGRWRRPLRSPRAGPVRRRRQTAGTHNRSSSGSGHRVTWTSRSGRPLSPASVVAHDSAVRAPIRRTRRGWGVAWSGVSVGMDAGRGVARGRRRIADARPKTCSRVLTHYPTWSRSVRLAS